jgi:class 3 adenylate cyclase
MRDPIDRAARAIARRNSYALVWAQFGVAHVVMLGGGGGRVEFTVIGETVNTAARVGEATRHTGDGILVTNSTRERLPSERFEFDERPSVPMKGKRERVRLWAPRALAKETTPRIQQARSVVRD